jgi:acyl carrier protein
MTHEEGFDYIIAFFMEQFEIPREKITLEARLLDDLGLDSIDALDMIGMFEAQYDIEVNEEELRSIRTVQHVIDFLVKAIP